MKLLPINCNQCNKIIYRSIGRINESIKFGWKTLCSEICKNRARNKQQLIKCSNPSCNKTFKRQQKAIQPLGKNYCSKSCSISINNSKFPKRKALKKNCLVCNKEFKGREKFCSVICKNKSQIISGDLILEQIKSFYNKNARIPFKNEFSYTKSARLRFGTWNKAIKSAGFEPNPVMFAKKYIAKDGHKCDSLAEKIIDDWLYARKLIHERSIPYGINNMTADFKVNNTFIEFFGLAGQLKSYDKLVEKKRKLWKEKGLKVIEIYPNHLFPKNQLEKILNF